MGPFPNKNSFYLGSTIVFLSVLLGWWFFLYVPQDYIEVTELNNQHLSFDEYVDYFEHVAEEKGAPYAFEVLRRVNLVPGTDLHLLGHVVGDVLYRQEGIEGIHECTQDFRNACSHSIVVGLFTDRGIEALEDIANACQNAPGGTGAYTMCFHGLGHGILAYSNYDFEQAVELCKKTGTPERNNREYIECVGGTTMEMIAGVHDRNAWEMQQDKYFDETDPLTPCNQSYVPEDARPICYTYLTPHLFEFAGGNLGNLSEEIYIKAFKYCNAIPTTEQESRDACFGGLGKEFIVLAAGRDVRDLGSLDDASLSLVRRWCALTDDPTGELVCNANALGSLFWGGENNPDASFAFCSVATDEQLKNECYAQLAHMISGFLRGTPEGDILCKRLPEPHRDFCVANI